MKCIFTVIAVSVISFLNAQQQLCVGSTHTYSVDLADGNEGTPGSTYTWEILDPNLNDFDPLTVGGSETPQTASANQYLIAWGNATPGIYTLNVTEENGFGCMDMEPLSIELIDDTPVLTISSNSPQCIGTDIIITATSTIANVTFEWDIPNGATDPGNVSSFTTNVAGTYSVTATSMVGCVSNTVPTTISFNTGPIIENVVQDGVNVTVTASGEPIPLEYSNDGVTFFENQNTFTFESGEAYTIFVRNANGCVSTASGRMPFITQNTITPNGDGLNDVFLIQNLDDFPNANLQVFDRYGKKLFESSTEGQTGRISWDGTYLGRPLPTTTYWYLFDLGDGSEVEKGFVFVKNRN